MNNIKRKENKDKNSVNDFLYAMGITGKENNESYIESPADFAYAMGVSKYIGHKPEKKTETISAPITAKLKYI